MVPLHSYFFIIVLIDFVNYILIEVAENMYTYIHTIGKNVSSRKIFVRQNYSLDEIFVTCRKNSSLSPDKVLPASLIFGGHFVLVSSYQDLMASKSIITYINAISILLAKVTFN